MNREEARRLINHSALSSTIEFNRLTQGQSEEERKVTLQFWVENWDVITAFAEGDRVLVDDEERIEFSFLSPRLSYTIMRNRIDWNKAVIGGALGLYVININSQGKIGRLAGVDSKGHPIVEMDDGRISSVRAQLVDFGRDVFLEAQWLNEVK